MKNSPFTTITTPSPVVTNRNSASTSSHSDSDGGVGVGIDSDSGSHEVAGENVDTGLSNEEGNNLYFKREGELARLKAMRSNRIEEERAGEDIANFLENVRGSPNNEAQSTCSRYAWNFATVGVRQSLSVCIQTLFRQWLDYTIESNLKKNQLQLRMGLAAAAALYPVLLNVVGLVRDASKNEETTSSVICRAINIAVGMGVVGVAGYRGLLPDLAAPLIAFNAFCIFRDFVQICLPLENGIYEVSLKPTLGSAAAYWLNQTAVNSLMTLFASPSGHLAAHLPYGQIVKNDMIRALINTAGETVDLLTMAGLQHCWNGGKLTIKLDRDNLLSRPFFKMITGVYTARTSLLMNLLLISAIIFSFFDPKEIVNPGWDMLIAAMIDAAIVAFGYTIFMGIATRANFGYSSDAQTDGQLIR